MKLHVPEIMRLHRRNYLLENIILMLIVFGMASTVVICWIFDYQQPDISHINIDDLPEPSYDIPALEKYSHILESIASKDKTLVMALVDSGYINMSLNFYYSSIVKHYLRNVLLIALDDKACRLFKSGSSSTLVSCFQYKDDESPDYTGSGFYKDEVYPRRLFVLAALKLGYNIILTDLDVIFVKNPVTDVKMTCSKRMCDMAAIWDDHLEIYNTGFMYIRSSESSIRFYEHLAAYEMSHGVGQLALNAALRQNRGKHAIPLTVAALNPKKYVVGFSFFQHNNCPDKKDYEGIVLVHNNYILEVHNKMHRFKECMLWDLEGTDKYYGSKIREYISVEDVGPAGSISEHQTLLNAFLLGHILDRTVILPKFNCKRKKCNLLQRIYDNEHLYFMRNFHNATKGNYRESSFLSNPRVPVTITDSTSMVYHIAYGQETPKKINQTLSKSVQVVIPKTVAQGPSEKEIMNWFGHNSFRVLRFDSLHGHFNHLDYMDILGEQLVRTIRQL